MSMPDPTQQPRLSRNVGTFGAVMMGLGSIIGTGVFVSIGIAAGVTGPAVLLAILIGAAVATFNGLSSAQLAAAHPVSGGSYEYGYRYLNSWFGFTAGWLFLLAKSASAATAALGFAGYLLLAAGAGSRNLQVPIALVTIGLMVVLVLAGIQRTNRANVVMVGITLLSLGVFVAAGLPALWQNAAENFTPFLVAEAGRTGWSAVLYGSALMFVAFTGYGRIATLGEEVREPSQTIPRAIVAALITVVVVYVLVALVGVGSVGAAALAEPDHRAAPLVAAARTFGVPGVAGFVALGAITAMLGVLLNLVLGLSRVLLAMGRRGDAPTRFGRLNAQRTTPTAAVIAVGVVIAVLATTGNVKTTWSFSAFTVLIYYAITNLACLRLPREARRYPRWFAVAGLVSCVALAYFVDREIWLVGTGLIALGLAYHALRRRSRTGS